MIVGGNIDYDQHGNWVTIGLLGKYITEEEFNQSECIDITISFNFVDSIVIRMSNDEND